MVTQRRYTSLQPESSGSVLKVILVGVSVLFLVFFIYGAKQVFNELRAISEGQQELILKLTSVDSEALETFVDPEGDIDSGNYVSRVEFAKYRNESRKQFRDLVKEIRLVQAKLRMKQTVLDDY